MKKTYIEILTILIVLASFTSCNGWLDNQPEGKIVLDDFWKSEADVDAMVATCYRSLITADGDINKPRSMESYIVWGEVRSDNVTPTLSSPASTFGKINEANILPTNPYANWSSFYGTINYCNLVLYYAPKVIDPNFSTSELRAREAEVLAIRALSYFYLVRAFKNVPLILTPSSTDNQDYEVAQSSEDEILDQLESDLLRAESMAVSSYSLSRHNKGRFTKHSIRALLADIYLWRNKYTECVAYCDKVIAEPTYKMIINDLNPFQYIFGLKNSTESIFELQFESANNYPNIAINSLYGEGSGSSRTLGAFVASDFICLPDKKLVYDNPSDKTTPIVDVRRMDNISEHIPQFGYPIFKYVGMSRRQNTDGSSSYNYRYGLDYPNWIVYRLTDLMLMKAEALVQLGVAGKFTKNDTIALHMVNLVHMRSNPTLLLSDSLKLEDYPSIKDRENLVLLERQKELMFEGKRWFDLMRVARRDGNTNRLLDLVIRKYTDQASMVKSKLKDMNSLYWPVSEDEMKANSKLVQNPYYLTKVNN